MIEREEKNKEKWAKYTLDSIYDIDFCIRDAIIWRATWSKNKISLVTAFYLAIIDFTRHKYCLSSVSTDTKLGRWHKTRWMTQNSVDQSINVYCSFIIKKYINYSAILKYIMEILIYPKNPKIHSKNHTILKYLIKS